jgi:hypothetical protein
MHHFLSVFGYSGILAINHSLEISAHCAIYLNCVPESKIKTKKSLKLFTLQISKKHLTLISKNHNKKKSKIDQHITGRGRGRKDMIEKLEK